jgi:Domain of unknown function (DUF305)
MGIVRLTILLTLVTVAASPSLPAFYLHRPAQADGPGWAAFVASMEKMHAGMAAVEPMGNCDVDFVRLMLPHHQAAMDMAKAQLLYGRDPQIRRLAQEIITDQQSEIELMELWLKQQAKHTMKMQSGPSSKTSAER